MSNITLPSITLIFFSFFIYSCDSRNETLEFAAPEEYVLSQPGKYIIYQLDSLIFPSAGRAEAIHSYQEKHLVDAVITDAMGRQSLRIYRYLRDSAGRQPWSSAGVYLLTPLQNSVEMVEDNLRVITLAAPLKQGNEWKGNSYLNAEPYSSLFDFSNDDDMKNWNFRIVSSDETIVLNGRSIPDVTTVLRIDDQDVPDTIHVSSANVTITNPSKTIWLKGIATDSVRITASAPASGTSMTIYNRTNQPVSLNNIPIPVNFGRNYMYSGSRWTYGDNMDTLYADMPYAYRNYGIDKYAKNIGLVYQELFLWEFQPNIGGTPYKVGFGIKRSMIEHN